MALSRELLKRLSSEEYPLPKRLKLVETAFSSIDLPLVRKEDLLLEWLCGTCLTNQYAWKILNNCLKFAHIDVKVSVKQCLVDALVQTLNSDIEDVYDDVLDCCNTILINSSMRQYFINKPKSLGLLIKALLNNVLKHSSCHNVLSTESDGILETYHEISSMQSYTIINVIENLMQIYKLSIATKDELRSIFTHDILYPMCSLIDHRCTDNTNKFGVMAYKCIQQLLLGKNKSIQHKQTESSQTTFSDLFCVLSKNVETLDLQSNFLTYQFIFRAAIGIYKSDTVSLDKFFRNLVNSAGKYKWEILNACLKLLNDVMFDFDNAIDEVTLFEYFQRFINDILAHSITSTQYRILAQLAYINPLLIEKNISDILDKVLMDEQTTDYTNLLIAILHASTKLRREQKFIAQLLISLKRHIAMKKTCKINASAFFPHEFKTKLAKTIGNLSNSQAIAVLKTLIYYLNTDCIELLQCDTSCCKNALILKVTVELLILLFECVQIFECTRTLPTHDKLVNTLDEVGNALSQLINKSLCLTYNKNVTIILLNAVLSLSEIENMLKYYLPKSIVTNKLSFPILDDPWQQLIQRITNFGEDNCKIIMNKLILHRIRLNMLKKPIRLDSLIGGIEYSWNIILRHNIDILSLLCDKDISKVTHLLLADMMSSESNFREWLYILDKECLQENRRFIMCLSSHILIHIGQCLPLGCTKSIIKHINAKHLMEDNENKLLEVLQVIKEQISQEQWVQITDDISSKIKLHLEILSLLPMLYLRTNVRTLIFLVVYSINRECEANDIILTLCNTIFSELLKKPGIDIFQYIEPVILINQLMRNKIFSKACEFSFRKVTTYDILKSLIKNIQCKETMCIILECIQIIKPKLNTEQKAIFKKAEIKLAKAILKTLPDEINDVRDIKCLLAVLKVIILTEQIPDSLKKLAELTLKNMFTAKEDSGDTSNDTLLQQNVQLAVIVLRHRKMFEVEDAIIKNLWSVMLKYPCRNLFELLLASTEVKEFSDFLKMLRDQTINNLSQTDETMWTNLFIIWNDMMKIDMNVKRNKMRLAMVNDLLKSIELLDIPDKCWSDLLRLLHDIIGSKHLLISNSMVDFIMMISLKSLDKMKISSCENVIAICGKLLKVRTNLITDKLPVLLLLYRKTVSIIVHASKNVADKFEEHRFTRFALDIEKLTGLLIKLKKDMIRLSPYLIADLLQLIVEGTAPSYIKTALQNILCQLISICDQHGITFLSRVLPTSLQEVFKVQLDLFNKFYKYSGKI